MSVPPARSSALNQRLYRDTLGRFATGVTIITTRAADGGCFGLTVSSFNSLSLDPPLILWSLGLRSTTLRAFLDCTHFAVNVLASDQVALSRRFASANPNRFAGVAFREGTAGVPLIDGCIAWFECLNRARHEAGDHLIFIGEVLACARADGQALLFHDSRYGVCDDLPER